MNIRGFAVMMACFSLMACTSQDDNDSAEMTPGSSPDKETVTDNNSTRNNQPEADAIVGKKWQLMTLEGQDVEPIENQEQARYFQLDQDKNRVMGFSGCNTFNGTYTLESGMRIRFSQMASTMKACPDVDVDEQAFLAVFELTDNYTLRNGELSLNVGRRAPLAVFEAQ